MGIKPCDYAQYSVTAVEYALLCVNARTTNQERYGRRDEGEGQHESAMPSYGDVSVYERISRKRDEAHGAIG